MEDRDEGDDVPNQGGDLNLVNSEPQGVRARLVAENELDAVYMMGFDAWSDGQSVERYLAECRASPKYAKGVWYALKNGDGEPVSSLIAYRLDRFDGADVFAIGSIATTPHERRKGHASALIADVMDLLDDPDGEAVFYLWSDVDPRLYERMGFARLPGLFQSKAGSVAMVRRRKPGFLESALNDPQFRPPSYF